MAWTLAQTKSVSGGGSDPVTIAFTSSVAAGSTIIVACACGGSTDSIVSMTDTLSNTYTQRTIVSGRFSLWAATSASGGSNTITVNDGGGIFGGLSAFEFDGGAGGFDAAGTPNHGTSASPSVSSFTTASGDLQFAMFDAAGTDSASGLTNTGTVVNGAFDTFWGTSSGSSSSLSATLQFSLTWDAVMIAMKASGGGGGTTSHLLSTMGVGA